MLNRRQFLSAAAAGAAVLARSAGALAAQASKYDLIIKGGRVIDQSVRLDAVRDLGHSREVVGEAARVVAANEGVDGFQTEQGGGLDDLAEMSSD